MTKLNRGSPMTDEMLVEKIEEIVHAAYGRGFHDGAETVIEWTADGATPEMPHKDAQGEACGDYMAEAYPRIREIVADRLSSLEEEKRVHLGLLKEAREYISPCFSRGVELVKQIDTALSAGVGR